MLLGMGVINRFTKYYKLKQVISTLVPNIQSPAFFTICSGLAADYVFLPQSAHDSFCLNFCTITFFRWRLQFVAKQVLLYIYQTEFCKYVLYPPSVSQPIHVASLSHTLKPFSKPWDVIPRLNCQHQIVLWIVRSVHPSLHRPVLAVCLIQTFSVVFCVLRSWRHTHNFQTYWTTHSL